MLTECSDNNYSTLIKNSKFAIVYLFSFCGVNGGRTWGTVRTILYHSQQIWEFTPHFIIIFALVSGSGSGFVAMIRSDMWN